MEIKGIDVSAYNPVTDYAKVREAGIRAAILRITQSDNSPDPTFLKNYKGFRDQKLKIGVYKYSYALNETQAYEEAEAVLRTLNNRALDFPVFYDLEWSRQRALGASAITKIVKAFRRVILAGGYLFGIYCNLDWYSHVLDTESLPYDYWLASYPSNDQGVLVEALRPSVGIGWQYSSKGRVPGISGDVDLDVFYKTYPVRPKSNCNLPPETETPEHESPDFFLYTIRPGDTLSAIAEKYHTTVQKLVRLNHIADPDLIFAGETLKIPR